MKEKRLFGFEIMNGKDKSRGGIGRQEKLGRVDNYNKGIIENFQGYFGARVLEVGCSIGNLTKFFLSSELLVGIDIDGEAIGLINKKFKQPNFKAPKTRCRQ